MGHQGGDRSQGEGPGSKPCTPFLSSESKSLDFLDLSPPLTGVITGLRSLLCVLLIKTQSGVWGLSPWGPLAGWLHDHPEFLALSGPLASAVKEVPSRWGWGRRTFLRREAGGEAGDPAQPGPPLPRRVV